MTQGYETYKAVQAQTATRAELVGMLYEGAIRFLHHTARELEERNLEMAHASLVKAHRIIEELQMSIDRQQGPVADGLNALYAFLLRELEVANVRKDRQKVLAAAAFLGELLAAWQGATGARRGEARIPTSRLSV